MTDFLKNNQQVFILILLLLTIALIVLAFFNHVKTNKLVKSMLVNKFKVVDMNEKSTADDSTLYTIIVSNNSMNAITIASIGFEHNGDFFNFRNECKSQFENFNRDLVVLPRGSIKLRLFQEHLEGTIFKTIQDNKLKSISAYVIGMGGENCRLKAKVITKKMQENFKVYYTLHKPEIMAKFVATCEKKIKLGIKLSLFEKLRYNSWKKQVSGELPEINLPDWNKTSIPAPETQESLPNVVSSAEIDNPHPDESYISNKKNDSFASQNVTKEANELSETNENAVQNDLLENKTKNNQSENENY